MKSTSKIKVDFKREGEKYSAVFGVKREQNSPAYNLNAEVFDSKGKKIFEKQRRDLDYSQVEPALLFVFHQAFVES